MTFARLVSIFLFSFVLLQAGDYNSSLIDAKPSVYKALLKTLADKKINTEEVLLQKVLLKKLSKIDTNATVKVITFKIPKNSKQYEELFDKFMNYALMKGILLNKTKQVKVKIQTLKDEIKNTKNNNPSLFTIELQDAFYNKIEIIYKKKINTIQNSMKSIEKILSNNIKNIGFKKDIIEKNIKIYESKVLNIGVKISKMQIEKERLSLLIGEEKRVGNIDHLMSKEAKKYQDAILKSTALYFLDFSDALSKKDKSAFVIEKKILKSLQKLKFSDSIILSVEPLIRKMEKQYLGTINVIASSTRHEFRSILTSVWDIVTKPLFVINDSHISIMKLIIATVIFILGYYIGGLYRVNIKKFTKNISSINSTTRNIFSNLGYYIIIVIAFIIALNVLGINLSSIGLVAGALSVGIGFGLQNIVSNFISGIILMFERSIKIGDFIELSDDLKGHVTGIHMRSTTISTNSNIDVIVPNQNFIQNNVINWTMNDEIKRFQIPFGVAYGTKPERVIQVIQEALKQSGYTDIVNTPQRHSRIIMMKMGDSSVDFELFVWVKGSETLHPNRTTSRFLILVYNTLYENNIEIPFPQQDIHIKSIDSNIKGQSIDIKNP